MKLVIRKIAEIEDKVSYSIDPEIAVTDDELLREHRRIKRILLDRYHYFEKTNEASHPNRWVLYVSTI